MTTEHRVGGRHTARFFPVPKRDGVWHLIYSEVSFSGAIYSASIVVFSFFFSSDGPAPY